MCILIFQKNETRKTANRTNTEENKNRFMIAEEDNFDTMK
jgi:hypothetical protein